jgi:ferredoxin
MKNQGSVEVSDEFVDDVLEVNDVCPSGSIKIANELFNGDPMKYE